MTKAPLKNHTKRLPRRGRWQFTVRSLLVAMFLVAVLGSWLAFVRMQYAAQMSLATQIRQYGGKCDVSTKDNGWMKLLLGADLGQRIVSVTITDDCIRPEIMVHMEQLFALEDFTAMNTKISDDDLVWVQKAKRLQRINLAESKITDRGVEIFSRNSALTGVSLHDTAISDEGLKLLTSRLPKIVTLDIMETRVTDKGIVYLASSPNLWQLSVGGEQITDQSIDTIGKFWKLGELTLWHTHISRDGIIKLQKRLPDTRVMGPEVSAAEDEIEAEELSKQP